jgi:YHS domain-containing protein
MSQMNVLRYAPALLIGSSLAWLGCSSSTAPGKVAAPAAGDTAAKDGSSTAIPDGFKDLSEADRAAALAQKVCPVSGDKLGEMGTPFKINIKGRDVFLCCPSCKDDLLKDPDKYLAKLDAK